MRMSEEPAAAEAVEAAGAAAASGPITGEPSAIAMKAGMGLDASA